MATAPPLQGRAEGRVPPHDLDAENSVLGAILLDPTAITRVLEFLRSEDFYRENNGQIYRAAVALFQAGEPIDNVTLAASLERLGVLERVGGRAQLALLAEAVPTAANIEYYARIVKSKAIKRKLIQAGGEVAAVGFDESVDADDALNRAEKAVFDVAEDRVSSAMSRLYELLRPAMDRIDAQMTSGNAVIGVPSGFYDLDNLTSGFKASDLIVVAGRPAMGKCLTAGTLIDDPVSGARLTIEEFVARRLPLVWGVSEEGRVRPTAVGDWVDSGVQETYRVRTRTGRHVEVTGHHPFLTVLGWQPLHDLRVGDKVAVPRVVPGFGQDDSLALDQVRLLAYYIAEGGLTRSSPAFSNTDPEILDDFRSILAHRFPDLVLRQDGRCTYIATQGRRPKPGDGSLGAEIRRCRTTLGLKQADLASIAAVSKATVSLIETGHYLPRRRVLTSIHKALGAPESISPDAYAHSNPLRVWLHELGLWGKGAAEKSFPALVWQWDRPRLREFLRALISCDGTIYAIGGYPRIEFAVASRGLAEDVQHALTRFGIVAKLWRKTARCWRLEITEPLSVMTFQREIGWIGEKANRFASLVPIPDGGRNRPGNVGQLPAAIWPVLRVAAKQKGMHLSAVAVASGEWGAGVRGYNLHSSRGVTQSRLAAFAEVLDDSNLRRLSSPDLYWDELVSVEHIERQQVYDLTVPDGANFVAQDVVVHNTSFMLNLTLHAAVERQVPVAVFSLEMSKEQLVERLLCQQARIDSQRMHKGMLSEAEYERLVMAIGPLENAPIFIDDSPVLDELSLLLKARQAKLREGIGMIVLDYLQLMTGRGGRGDDFNRVQEVSSISRSLKALARELHVPLIAISQLSRAPEARPNKRPMLSDLRESGSIEQDSDIVIFLYRDEYYNPNTDAPGIAEVNVAKHRNGPTDTVKLRFRKDQTLFYNLESRRREVET